MSDQVTKSALSGVTAEAYLDACMKAEGNDRLLAVLHTARSIVGLFDFDSLLSVQSLEDAIDEADEKIRRLRADLSLPKFSSK